MRNIYDIFNNVKPIDVEDEALEEREIEEIVKKLSVNKNSKNKVKWAAACIAGAIALTGGTAYAYSQGIFEEWIDARNEDKVSEEYIDNEFIANNYDGVVDVKEVYANSDVSFDILRMNVTDHSVYIAMVVTYDEFDSEKYADFNVELILESCDNYASSSTTASNTEYPNLQLNNNQRLICTYFDVEDTSQIKDSGEIVLCAKNLHVMHAEPNSVDENGNVQVYRVETADAGHWDLTIPITDYADVKYATIPENSDIREICISNVSMNMRKSENKSDATPEEIMNSYSKIDDIKIIMDDGEILDNLVYSGSGIYESDYSFYSWDFIVPIDIDKVKSIEIDGECYDIIK